MGIGRGWTRTRHRSSGTRKAGTNKSVPTIALTLVGLLKQYIVKIPLKR